MYQCESCNRTVGPNIPEHRMTDQVRRRTYYNEDGVFEGEGIEIVRTRLLCPFCASANVSKQLKKEVRKTYMKDNKIVILKPIFEE